MSDLALGYSITSAFPHDVEPRVATEAILDRAAVAAEAGFDVVEAGDHHAVAGGNYLQNVPSTARLTEHFDRVAAMFLLPLYHPVLLAEQVGTLDAFVDQFDFWCGVGYGQAAFGAFGVPLAERARRFEETLELCRRLWNEDDVHAEGEFHTLSGTSVNPKADPRIVIGGTAEPAVRRAARLGDAWVANADVPLDAVEKRLDWLAEEGGSELDVLIRRDAVVLEDGEAAVDAVAELLEAGYRGWGPDADWVLQGDPASVAEELAALRQAGIDEVVVRPMVDHHARATLRGVARARELI